MIILLFSLILVLNFKVISPLDIYSLCIEYKTWMFIKKCFQELPMRSKCDSRERRRPVSGHGPAERLE